MKNSYDSVAESWVSSELVASDEVIVRTVESYRAETCEVPSPPTEFIENFSDEQLIGQCELVSEYYTASSDVSLLSDLDGCQNDLAGKEERRDLEQLSDLDDRCQNDLAGKEDKEEILLLSDLDERCQNDLVEKEKEELSLLSDLYGFQNNLTQKANEELLLSQPADLEDRCQDNLTGKEEREELSPVYDANDRSQIDVTGNEERGERVIAGHVAAMRERFESMTRANTPCLDLARSCSPSLEVFRITPSPDTID